MTSTRRRTLVQLVGIVVVLVVALAACSDDDGGDGGEGAATDASVSAAALDGDPIRVMVTGTLDSAVVSFPQAVDGAEAAAAAINADGGVDGHPIEVLSCNDGLDPNAAVACAQEGIDDGVIAFVGGLELFNTQVLPVLEAAEVPWVAPEVLSDEQMTSPISFPLDAGAPMTFVELGRQLVEQGGDRVVLTLSENPNAEYNQAFIEQGVELAGGEVVDVVTYPLTQTEFSVTGQSIANADPDAVGCACAASDFAQVLPAMRQAGFDGPFGVTLSSARNEDVEAMGDAAGELIFTSAVRVLDDEGADIDQLRAEVEGVGDDIVRDGLFTKAWLGVHVIADALAGVDTFDAATLIEQLDGFVADETYGVLEDIDLTAQPLPDEAPRLPSTAVVVYTWDGEAKVPTGDGFIDPFRD